MSQDLAISVHGVAKSFKLPHEKTTGLKQAIIHFRPGKKYDMQPVLKDVSFDIKKGEFFGIVGRNGSGKSTLLKILAQIYTPDKGAVHIGGSLTPFIELGVGFNPELTGRENIFLNGALLGFDRKEVGAMYEDIVEFAELAEFMDQKLKNYSSGMQVRLAFSIAIRSESDILLIDEVLAVGDAAFQAKCFDVFESYKAKNRTIVLVTHDMDIVKRFCDRALYIETGCISVIGAPEIVAEEYRRASEDLLDATNEKYNTSLAGSRAKLTLLSADHGKPRHFKSGDTAIIRVDYTEISETVGGLGVALYKSTGEYVFGANTFRDKVKFPSKNTQLDYSVSLAIGEGSYMVKVAVFGADEEKIIEFVDQGPKLKIVSSNQTWEGIVNLHHGWSK